MSTDQPETIDLHDLTRRQVASVDARLASLNPGETLCIHDEAPIGVFDRDGGACTFTIRAKAHVLPGGVTCDLPERRRQYGPAPADWRQVVQRLQR